MDTSQATRTGNPGSDVVNMKCLAEKTEGGYVFNGQRPKSEHTDRNLHARTDTNAGPHGITAFIIEKGMEGFSTTQMLKKLEMRGNDLCEFLFENCCVPNDQILGQEGKVISYVHERMQFGKPNGEFQLMQGKLADMTRKWKHQVLETT